MTKKKKALITGITGQDGSYLAEFLLSKGYQVSGMVIENDPLNYRNLMTIKKDLKLYKGNLKDKKSLIRIIKKVQPDEVYNLGYDGPPFESNNRPDESADVTGLGAIRLFTAVKDYYPKAKIFQASSASMFNGSTGKKSEVSKMTPSSIYGVAKLCAYNAAKIIRDKDGVFIASGILFNHTSPRESLGFIVPKITYSAACAKVRIKKSKALNELGQPIVSDSKVKLGNIDVVRDIGYAADYVEAMWLMLQQERACDYVIGTGRGYSIKKICEIAYSYVGLDWRKYVISDKKLLRKEDPEITVSNITKAKKELTWQPKVKFDQLIAMMVDSNVNKLTK